MWPKSSKKQNPHTTVRFEVFFCYSDRRLDPAAVSGRAGGADSGGSFRGSSIGSAVHPSRGNSTRSMFFAFSLERLRSVRKTFPLPTSPPKHKEQPKWYLRVAKKKKKKKSGQLCELTLLKENLVELMLFPGPEQGSRSDGCSRQQCCREAGCFSAGGETAYLPRWLQDERRLRVCEGSRTRQVGDKFILSLLLKFCCADLWAALCSEQKWLRGVTFVFRPGGLM